MSPEPPKTTEEERDPQFVYLRLHMEVSTIEAEQGRYNPEHTALQAYRRYFGIPDD